MPYIATKPRLIAGKEYGRGEVVDTSALTVAKLASLIRVGLLVQQDLAPAAGVALVEPVVETTTLEGPEGICPVCEGGPYKRLDLHMERQHNEESV